MPQTRTSHRACTIGDLPRATHWQLRTRQLTFGRLPLLMGIVNVTPDSFSDGGRYLDVDAAVRHGLELVAQGADILDIGGESTRPYASPVDVQEELKRVSEVVRRLCLETDLPISIDTSKAEVAELALHHGAEIVNDVTGLEGDPAMIELVASTGTGVCVMHMQGTPATMQDQPTYDDVVEDISVYLEQRRDHLEQRGVTRGQICLDPGIGFGKTHTHNLELLMHCDRYHELCCPLLIGHSRKGFIGKVLTDKEVDPVYGTVGVSLALAQRGVQILRVHDVAAVRQALRLFAAAGGLDRRS